jgi:putative ABC transport system substrate-binding protein
MKALRREFITLIGAAVVWPLALDGQQTERVRRIGALMNRAMDDAEGVGGIAAFRLSLEQLGWSEGRNVRIDIRWGENNVELERRYAAELAALAPDIFLASGTVSVEALQQVSRTVPIVFVGVVDPVGAGFIETLSRPGGNITV